MFIATAVRAYTEAAAARRWSPPKWPTATKRSLQANPIERVRDLIEDNRNYFPNSNSGGKSAGRMNVPSEQLFAALGYAFARKAFDRHGIMPSMSCARRCGASIAIAGIADLRTGRRPRPRFSSSAFQLGACRNAAPV